MDGIGQQDAPSPAGAEPEGRSASVARLLPAIGGSEVVERLARLSGSDFTSLMLEVARRRAAAQTPASVLRRYRADRFVRPATQSWRSLRRAEDLLAANLPAEFELVTLSPLVPLGTHSRLGPVSQDKVVTAMRAVEVAADATNALALEAAHRRRADQSSAIQLAGFQRVVRAQQVVPGYLPHFGLLGLITAGRDEGGHQFERQAVTGHVRALAAGLAAAGFSLIQLALTALSGTGETIARAVSNELAPLAMEVVLDGERLSGRAYYQHLCFKISVRVGGRWAEIGDGGFTDWTAQLLASRKERLLISGLGVDRLAALMTPV